MPPSISKELLEKAVKLHGHLGPFLVLGLRMALKAEEVLGEKPRGCEVETLNRKPYLCAVDGVKALVEKGPVIVREGNGLAAKFSGAAGKAAAVKVKATLLKKYAEGPWEKCEEYAREVIQSSDEELFEQIGEKGRGSGAVSKGASLSLSISFDSLTKGFATGS